LFVANALLARNLLENGISENFRNRRANKAAPPSPAPVVSRDSILRNEDIRIMKCEER
jgi:hypothetical protein